MKIKTYNKITKFSLIAQRYFINNFYDGILTVLGILLGFFLVVLKDPAQSTILSTYILLTGLSTSITMLISGISGSILSEQAEQKKYQADLDKAMGIFKDEEPKETDFKKEEEEIQKAMLKPIHIDNNEYTKKKQKKVKSLHKKAENFAIIVVSMVNGSAPFLGGIIPLIPFFIVPEASILTFLISFLIIFLSLILIGFILGSIAKESVMKSILRIIFSFIITICVIFIILG